MKNAGHLAKLFMAYDDAEDRYFHCEDTWEACALQLVLQSISREIQEYSYREHASAWAIVMCDRYPHENVR